MSKLILSKLDFSRIMHSINKARQANSISISEAETLSKELNDAKVVEPHEIPTDVVTMNSVVRVIFLHSGKTLQFQIVYPGQANIRENKISIFSPVATALIGYKVKDEIEWVVPSGITRIKIDDIVYQPEAAGNFHL